LVVPTGCVARGGGYHTHNTKRKEEKAMAMRFAWMVAAGLPLLLIGGSPAVGRATETDATAEQPKTTEQATTKVPEASASPVTTAKAPAAKRPAGLVGEVVAVNPNSHTIVVDVPQGKDTLRIGAEITDQTKVLVGGKEASLDALKEGERVRIVYHRTSDGDAATSLVVLRSSMG
jgi:hypothetical protein